MENTKTLMAQFYSRCQENGYTDMDDAKQSLKAKMIAMELKLDYGDIVAFYQEAQHCFEQVSAEQKRLEQERRIQQQKEDEEAARRAVNGQLLASLYDIGRNSKSQISVYQRPDKSIYYTIGNGQRNEGVPEISVHKSGSLQYTYHPSQAVYTGATVGGVTTGGVHHTKASLSERVNRSEKGYFEIKAQDTSFEVDWVELSDYTCNRFARDTSFTRYVENKKIVCYDPSVKSSLLTYAANPTSSLSYYDRLSIGSMALDERRLPFDTSAALARLVGQIIHAQFPPTDEEYYNKAVGLAKKETSAELKQAVDLFMLIRDFRDAAEQAVFANDRYQEILQQEEKEAAKEAAEQARIIKKILKITIPAAVAVFAVILLVTKVIIPNQKAKQAENEFDQTMEQLATIESYGAKLEQLSAMNFEYDTENRVFDVICADAEQLLENGEYEQAVEAFTAIGEYADSSYYFGKADIAKKPLDYAEAEMLIANGSYEEALVLYKSLGDYEDSRDKIIEIENQLSYDKAISLLEATKYEEAYDIFVVLEDYNNAEEMLSRFNVVYKMKTETRNGDTAEEYSYDSTGNLVKKVSTDYDGDKNTTEYSYDLTGNLVREVFTDYKGQKDYTEYSYDSTGNLVKEVTTYPDGDKHIIEYSYDIAGNLVKNVETWSDGGKSTIEYSYDSAGNLVKEVCITYYGNKTTNEYSYDSEGNLVKHVYTTGDGETTSEYSYDSAGNLVKENFTNFNGKKEITEYSYDAARNLVKSETTYDDGKKSATEYDYDLAGNLVKRVYTGTNGSKTTIEYSYDSAGNRIKYISTGSDGDISTQEYSYVRFVSYIPAG